MLKFNIFSPLWQFERMKCWGILVSKVVQKLSYQNNFKKKNCASNPIHVFNAQKLQMEVNKSL
jgi:hypothetical protein